MTLDPKQPSRFPTRIVLAFSLVIAIVALGLASDAAVDARRPNGPGPCGHPNKPVCQTPSPTTFTPTPTVAATSTPTLAPTPTPTLVPTPTPTTAPTATATSAPTATPTLAPTPTAPTPTPTVAPTPTPAPTIKSVRVTSIAAVLSTLADNTVDEIVVANGTYHVSPSSGQASDSLWIGSRFAGRTRPITVRAETTGGVTFDGGGEAVFGGISFEDGAHDQTWDGFNFNNGTPTQTGVVMWGGYGLPPAHHITLRNITMMSGIHGTVGATKFDHMMYFSNGSTDGAHDILIEDYTVNNPASDVSSALDFNHLPNIYNLTVRRMHVTGTQAAILMYAEDLHDVLVEDSDISGASIVALNAAYAASNVVLRNVTSVNSGGTYYPFGQPAGLTLVNCSLQ